LAELNRKHEGAIRFLKKTHSARLERQAKTQQAQLDRLREHGVHDANALTDSYNDNWRNKKSCVFYATIIDFLKQTCLLKLGCLSPVIK